MKFIGKLLRKICTILGAIMLVLLVLAGIGAVGNQPRLPDKIVLTLNIDEALTANETGGLLASLLPAPDPTLDIIRAIDRARRDDRVLGLIVKFGNAEPALAQAQEIRAALQRFKASKKFSYAYAPSFGELSPATRSYYLASTLDEVWVQPLGLVGLNGIAFEMPFWRGLLDTYGVKAEFIQRKAYKTAMAGMTDRGFTPEHRTMMTTLLDDITRQTAAGIAENRALPQATVAALLGTGPLAATDALQKRLIDKIAYQDELLDTVKQKAGKDARATPLFDYLALSDRALPAGFTTPDSNKAIAVIDVQGVIHSGKSTRMPGRRSAGADTIVSAFDAALKNDAIKAVVLRIDSPGGSAVASETIRRAVMKTEMAGKPVIVSMGTVAASGGYWVASGAKTILAMPATLTGSIGVVSGKLSGGDLLRQHNIAWGQIASGDSATMWSPATGFTATQRLQLEKMTDVIYDGFKQRVMEARGLDATTAERVAQGRVWTGAQAKDLKLTDDVGGMYEALNIARNKLGIVPDAPVAIVRLPAPPSAREQAMELLKFYRHGAIALPAAIDGMANALLPGTAQTIAPAY
jgi:protease-4